MSKESDIWKTANFLHLVDLQMFMGHREQNSRYIKMNGV